MPVTINSVGAVQRIRVTGDPSAAGSVPALASEGDLVYDESTGDTYEVGGAGAASKIGNSVGKAVAVANGWA